MFSIAALLLGLGMIVLIAAAWGLGRFASEPSPAEPGDRKGPVLTGFVKRALDVIWYFLIAAAVVYPLLAIAIGFDVFFDADRRYVDVFLGFKVYPATFPDVEAVAGPASEALIRGRDLVQLNTSSQLAVYVSAAIVEINLVIFLYGLTQMRAIFTSVKDGRSFARDIPGRIRKIGYLLIAWQVITPLLQYLSGRTILREIGNDLAAVELFPALELDPLGVLVGLSIIVLAGTWREATNMQEEQALTI